MSSHASAALSPAISQPRQRRRRMQKAREFLAAWIPFTGAFASHAHRVAQERMAAFRGLDLLEPAVRDELDDRVASLELRLARIELRRRSTLFVIAVLSFLAWGWYTYVVVPEYVIRELNLATSDGTLKRFAVPLVAAFVVVAAATVMLVVSAHRLLTRRFGARATEWVEQAVAAFFIVAWAANGLLNAWSVSANSLLFLAALYVCGSVVFVTTAGATLLVMARASRLYRVRAAALWPDAVIVHELLAVLVRLEGGSKGGWMELNARRDMLRRLERAARAMEQHLPRRLRHEDAANDAWLRQTTREVAAALRQAKQGLCLPDAGTRDELVRRLTDTLLHAIRGQWSRLERVECPAPPAPKRRSPAFIAARSLLFVGLAAVLVWDRGRSPAALLDLVDGVLKQASGLLIPLVAPVLAYTLLKTINPAALDSAEALSKLTGRK